LTENRQGLREFAQNTDGVSGSPGAPGAPGA